jgi:hypothetical protein
MAHWRVIYEVKRAGVVRTRLLKTIFETRDEAEEAAEQLREAGFDAGLVMRGRPTPTDRHRRRGKHEDA